MGPQGHWTGEIPVLLTVEEAGELLRIGRTKAYAMTREYRETNGQSGLPVVELGKILRVPRSALEQLIGSDLSNIKTHEPTNGNIEVAPPSPTRPRSKSRKHSMPQPDLFSNTLDSDSA